MNNVIIKPLLSEKANHLSEKKSTYSFIVDKKANKLEIKKAVEQMYSVKVEDVNTSIRPGKAKSRMTKKGILQGIKPAQKRALVKLAQGETINLFSDF